ncbi:MAG TPA: peptidase M4 family protein, partial [Marmoricola sp.]|nr:peptidase M4 family protein [Marmoricola sp.]
MRTRAPLNTRTRLAGVVAVAAATATAGLAQSAGAANAAGSDGNNPVAAAIASVKAHQRATLFGTGQKLHAVGTIVDPNGVSHVRLDRTYHGLEVVGGDVVVHQTRGEAWKGVSQTLDRRISLSTDPSVSRAAAETAAVAPSAVTNRISGDHAESATLVVDATSTKPRLAWRVMSGGVQADGTPSRLASYVDATTGAVIRTEQQIETADGSGQSLYSGTVPLQLTLSGSTYQLKDPTRGNTYTTDM